MSIKDDIFSDPQDKIQSFEFNQQVVEVFPDMIERSVPGYKSIIEGIGDIAAQFNQSNSNLYDLGCSLGAASFSIRQKVADSSCKIIAVDNSAAMVERCKLIQSSYNFEMPIDVIEGDINQLNMNSASIVVLNFTLQFLPLEQRNTLIEKIYAALKPGGVLILSEKLQLSHRELDEQIIELHHDFKKNNGYSDMEIAQKRAALENVLIPDSRQVHLERFQSAGFKYFDSWFQHYNFASFIAIK